MIVVDTVHIRHTRVWAVPNSLFRQSKAFSWISRQAVLCQLKFWHLIIWKSNIFSSHSSLKHLTWITGNALLQRALGMLGVRATPNILLTNTSHDTSHSGSGGCWGWCYLYVRSMWGVMWPVWNGLSLYLKGFREIDVRCFTVLDDHLQIVARNCYLKMAKSGARL